MKKDTREDFDGLMANVFFDEDGDYLAHTESTKSSC